MKKNYDKALTQGALVANNREFNSTRQETSCMFGMYNSWILQKLSQQFGLNRVMMAITIGRSADPEFLCFFNSIGVPLLEMYGSSETTGFVTMNHIDKCKIYTVGCRLPGIQTQQIEDTGELLVKGRNVFIGYLHNKELTSESFDNRGYFKTRDCLLSDEDGFMIVAGRIKELIMPTGGTNISPTTIEFTIRSLLPVADFIFVYGDGKKYLSCLVTLKCSSHPDDPSNDLLTDDVVMVLKSIRSIARTSREAICDLQLGRFIQDTISLYNCEYAASPDHFIRRWALLPHPFSIETGELTYTRELRRKVIESKYKDVLDSLYSYKESCLVDIPYHPNQDQN